MKTLDELTSRLAPRTFESRTFESWDPGKLWMLGIAVEPDGTLTGPGLRRYSFWADCECPDDCNRDHEND